jgi:hypothetical protein
MAPIGRREFLGAAASGAILAAAGPLRARALGGEPHSETLVAALWKSLDSAQRETICFPFDHPLRSRVDNNWLIVPEKTIAGAFTPDQRDLIRQIFRGLHSPEYADAILKQVEHDNVDIGGFGACSVALFGEPGTGDGKTQFEFVLTGRHVTRRCDGDSVAGAAFGGPIFYGHAAESFNEAPTHPGNVYWYQARRANALFQALDGKQRERALLATPRPETGTKTVSLRGKNADLAGLRAADMSPDQRALLRTVMADVLAPFRREDVEETLKLIERSGGLESLALSFYKNDDIGSDGVWDVWQIEGPSMVWYFRGAPHVHTWVHVRDGAT